nr:hypothetical protein [uncultured Moraxella sp.]
MFLKNLKLMCVMAVIALSACQKPNTQTAHNKANDSVASDDLLAGCYTVSHSEPAQIKINHEKTAQGERYTMQMREFNDPNKNWDTPAPMQVLTNDSAEIQKYFDIKADENAYLQKVIAREDRVFVLAKITDSFANMNPQFDSPYLGFIYKGSNTIYKVSCENTQAL